MKKAVFTIIIFLILLCVAFAQTDVNIRSSKKDGFIRLVFEAEEIFIKNTNVTSAGTQINVEFPSNFNIKQQKGFDLENSVKDRVLTINLKESFEMKVLKLSAPSRLVIDIATSKTSVDTKPQQEITLSQKVFVLDAGHGGYDFGITGNELKEKDIVLSIVKDIETLLIKNGKKVFLTRRGDQFMSLKDRAIFTNQKMPEIFVSIHVATSGNFALYIPKIIDTEAEQSSADQYNLGSRQKKHIQKSRDIAEGMGRSLKAEFNLNVIQREMSMPILNSISAPAVLIEVPSFKIMNYDQKTRLRLADAIIKGFSHYGQ